MTKRAKKAKALKKIKKINNQLWPRRIAGQGAKLGQLPAGLERAGQKESVDARSKDGVECPRPVIPPAMQGETKMTLTYKSLNKKGTHAIYSGIRTTIRVALACFEGGQPPSNFSVVGPFVGPAQRKRKPKLTAEERKAWRAGQPKPTLAERAARARKHADKLAAAAAAELQPAM